MNTNKNQKSEDEYPEEIIAGDDNQDIDLLGGDEDEFEFSNAGGQNKEDDEFDTIVGALQDIVIDEEFEMLQNDFLDKHCMVFEDEEENKLEYMPIFNNYQKTLEKYIEQKLKEKLTGFDMDHFQKLLETRIDQIDPQLLDMLLTLSDFQNFKEHILAYKKLSLSKKKKSKKFEEFKQEQTLMAQVNDKKQMVDLEQDFSDLMISGNSKGLISTSKPKATKVESTSKTTSNKAPATQPKQEKKSNNPPSMDEMPLNTPKRTVSKGNADYKAPKKDNIFS